jgi:hypothetical protein
MKISKVNHQNQYNNIQNEPKTTKKVSQKTPSFKQPPIQKDSLQKPDIESIKKGIETDKNVLKIHQMTTSSVYSVLNQDLEKPLDVFKKDVMLEVIGNENQNALLDSSKLALFKKLNKTQGA